MRISDWSSDVCSSDRELDDAALRLHLRLGEVAALRLCHPVRLGLERAELDRVIAVLLGGAHRHHLAIFHLQKGDRHVLAFRREHPAHASLLRNHTSTHRPYPLRLISTSTSRKSSELGTS